MSHRPELPRGADVVVVGGGVMGTSVAFHLAEDGADVVLLERDELGSGSSGKPIGGVRAQFSDPLNVALGARSLRAYEDFGRRPGADIGRMAESTVVEQLGRDQFAVWDKVRRIKKPIIAAVSAISACLFTGMLMPAIRAI